MLAARIVMTRMRIKRQLACLLCPASFGDFIPPVLMSAMKTLETRDQGKGPVKVPKNMVELSFHQLSTVTRICQMGIEISISFVGISESFETVEGQLHLTAGPG